MTARAIVNPLLRSRYPVVRQFERIDCGPAALLSVLKYHGGDASLARVRELAGTDVEGTSLLALQSAAGQLGLDGFGAAGSYRALVDEVEGPCIAHVIVGDRLRHYVVVYEATPRRVILGDPRLGLVHMSPEDFRDRWRSRAVLVLTPTQSIARERAPNWVRWMAAHFRRQEAWVVQSLFLGLLYTLLGLLTALFIQWLIDHYIPDRDWTRILIVGTALAAVLAVRALAGYLRQRFSVELVKRINTEITRGFLDHLFRLPLSFFDRHRTGDLASRVHDGVRIQNGMRKVLGTIVVDGFVLVGSVGLIFHFSARLGWLAAATVPLFAAFLALASGSLRTRQRSVLQAYGALESSYVSSLAGIEAVKSYGCDRYFATRNDSLHRDYQNRARQFGLTEATVSFFSDGAGAVLTVGLLILGAWEVLGGRLLLGEMIAAYSLLGSALPSAVRIADGYVSLQGATAAAGRLMDILLTEPEEPAGTQFHLERELAIRDGSFRWPNGATLLEEIQLTLARGSLTGIWGRSGSGKSTIVRILERKYRLSSGALLADGENAYDTALSGYRRQVGVLPENAAIFPGTVLDNIRLGRSKPEGESVESKLRGLGLGWITDRFPHGLSTVIGEQGRRVSSGERQLVGLLRALWDEPNLLVLDEGLHTLDVDAWERVLEFVERFAIDHAVLLISHEAEDLARCDALYELREQRLLPTDGIPVPRQRSARRIAAVQDG